MYIYKLQIGYFQSVKFDIYSFHKWVSNTPFSPKSPIFSLRSSVFHSSRYRISGFATPLLNFSGRGSKLDFGPHNNSMKICENLGNVHLGF